MKHTKPANAVLSVFFLLFLLGFAAVLFVPGMKAVAWNRTSPAKAKAALEKTYKAVEASPVPVFSKEQFVELNGFGGKLLGQRNINGVVKCDDGALYMPVHAYDVNEAVENVAKFAKEAQKQGKTFLFVQAPNKIALDEPPNIPADIDDDSRAAADQMVAGLREQDVPVLDLRETMRAEGIHPADAFFRTDHHWKPETGLWATTKILEHLAAAGAIDAVPEKETNRENFFNYVIKDRFLGSAGERVGQFYGGTDDLIIPLPKWKTDCTLAMPNNQEISETAADLPQKYVHESGRFEDLFVNRKGLDKKMAASGGVETRLYGYLDRNDRGRKDWHNAAAPIDKTIMTIGDSFKLCSLGYMPLMFRETREVDMRYYTGDFAKFFKTVDPDVVVLLFNPTAYANNNKPGLCTAFVN